MMQVNYEKAESYLLEEKKIREEMQINNNNTAYSKIMYILSLIEGYKGNHGK